MLKSIKSLYQVEQVRAFDRIAIDELAIPGFTLMQRAGLAAFKVLQQQWPKAKRVQVIVGKGNNAGDGYVIAKQAKRAGLKVEVLYLSPPEQLSGDALLAAQAAKKARVSMQPLAQELLCSGTIVVDALLGTGLTGDVRREYREAIEQINLSGNHVLAVDIPSGLHGDSGNSLGAAVRADCTVTFVGVKRGLFTGQAEDYCGEIFYDDLDLSAEVFAHEAAKSALLNMGSVSNALPRRQRTAHKGLFGHVLVVGGNYGMAGAVRMAAEAVARVGAGLTTVVTRPEHVAIVVGQRPELMCCGINYSAEAIECINKATVIIVGPGLGQDDWGKDLLREVLQANKPMVVDADALTLLAQQPTYRDDWVLTPHPGEAARLLGCSSSAIQQDRFAAVRALQARYGGCCVLKGSGSLVLGDSGEVGVCSAGNPGMASGGMGDVLSGLLGGLIAQGLTLEQAARVAVMLHATAADLAAAEDGERGLLALDLLCYVRKLIN